MDSLKHNVAHLSPTVIMLQETKVTRKGQIKIENYDRVNALDFGTVPVIGTLQL